MRCVYHPRPRSHIPGWFGSDPERASDETDFVECQSESDPNPCVRQRVGLSLVLRIQIEFDVLESKTGRLRELERTYMRLEGRDVGERVSATAAGNVCVSRGGRRDHAR